MPSPVVAYVIGTYPSLTTTFIDREVRLLRSWGATVDVISLRRPTATVSPEQAALAASTSYARPVTSSQLVRRHAHFLRRRPPPTCGRSPRWSPSRGLSLRDRMRTVGHFGLGVSVAGQLREAGRYDRIHAHFIDRAATVALVAARLLDVPYSVTAHAADIYVSPLLLRTKLAGGDFVATCTGYNRTHLAEVAPEAAEKIVLAYHGLDLERYDASSRHPSTVPTMLAVGQLREKKGFVHLLDACRQLAERGMPFRCEIIGEGPQRADLEGAVQDLGLEQHVALLGAQTHEEVIDAYRRAWVFVLPCVVGDDGDRDGIPNVILEAMAMGLPVVSTRHSGIPEVVEHEVTGLLVRPADATGTGRGAGAGARGPRRRRADGRAGPRRRDRSLRRRAQRPCAVGSLPGRVRRTRGEPAVTGATGLPPALADESVFIAWGPPAYTNRTRLLAAALGIEVRHVYSTRRRGALAAVVKYPYQAVATTWYLLRRRPALVFVQHPPSFAAMVAAGYAALTRASFVVDAHSDAFDSPWWTRPRWLQRRVARRAITTIVTNDHFAEHPRGPGRPCLGRARHPHAVRGRALRTGPRAEHRRRGHLRSRRATRGGRGRRPVASRRSGSGSRATPVVRVPPSPPSSPPTSSSPGSSPSASTTDCCAAATRSWCSPPATTRCSAVRARPSPSARRSSPPTGPSSATTSARAPCTSTTRRRASRTGSSGCATTSSGTATRSWSSGPRWTRSGIVRGTP